jgi:signal transduction histidine kinase
MLLSTQLDQGSLVLDPKPVNFSEIGRQIVRMMETMAENKGIELVNDSQVDLVHPADERSVRQIIINLLSNALKFTDRGRVTLCIRRESEGGQVEVSISDTGPGIPEAELGRLTEAYYQSKADSTKARSGAGLGLSIVNGLVIAHGGELTIESRVGEGSVFTATFPPLDPA